jgi:hypothetical protein
MYDTFHPRDSRDGRLGPGCTSGTEATEGTGAGAATVIWRNVRTMTKTRLLIEEIILSMDVELEGCCSLKTVIAMSVI